jgi:putative peptidoglycan lipid II flippase
VIGWIVVAGLDVLLVAATDMDRVTALGLGNTGGMTVAGVLLLGGLRRATPDALQGVAATAAAGLVAAAIAVGMASLVPSAGRSAAADVVSGLLIAAVVAVSFLGALRLIRPDALRLLRDV